MPLSAADDRPVRVVFRKWNQRNGGGVIALFPDLIANHFNGTHESYEHVGQHGGASYDMVIASSKPATPEEYSALKRELEGVPYHYQLKVIKRR